MPPNILLWVRKGWTQLRRFPNTTAKKEARKLFRANHLFIFPQTVKIQRNGILRCKVNLEKKIGILQRIWAKNDTEVEWSTDYSNFPKLDTSPPKCRLNSTKHISPWHLLWCWNDYGFDKRQFTKRGVVKNGYFTLRLTIRRVGG